MNNTKKELFFLSAIAVISFLCSFYPGVYIGWVNPINPLKNIQISSVEDIQSNFTEKLASEDLVFKNGYCYRIVDSPVSSEFYQKSIRNIPTSTYWRMPVSPIESIQILKRDKYDWKSYLNIPYQLTLPIFSITVDPDDFFSYENGIYVQGIQSDFIASKEFYPMPWNKPANYFSKENDQRKVFLAYYDINGKVKYSTYANAEINGKATRCFPQKSLKLEISNDSKHKNFSYNFFDSKSKFTSLVLRNGGNDNTKSLYRDMLMQSLMNNTGILTSNFLPCEVYLNGEYWGIHFLQNKMNDDFIAEVFDTKRKSVTIVENWQLDNGSEVEYNNLMSFVKDLDNVSYEDISDNIDMDNLAYYLAGQLFFANTDWPTNNLKMYKISNSKEESKWQFAFFDLDYGFGYTGDNAYQLDMFEYLNKRSDAFSLLFKRIMKEPNFRKILKDKFTTLIKKQFSKLSMNEKINQIEEQLSGSMERHTNRWQKPSSIEWWKYEVDKLRDFANRRNEIVVKQINSYLK